MSSKPEKFPKASKVVFEVGSKYEVLEVIGNGAYGVVCSAKDKRSEKKVAVKKICRVFEIPTIAKRTLRELKILRHFRHDNVIGMHDIIEVTTDKSSFKDVYIVLDLMESDLHNIIHSEQPLTDEHKRYFMYQLLRGLKYIHSANVIHRDLKPSNLLVNRDCQLKIGDFGMARSLSSSPGEQKRVMTEYVATRWYRAPELMLSLHQFTKGIDIWSVGCILAELFGRRPLFPGSNYLNQLQLILSVVGLPSTEFMATISSERVRKYIDRLPHKEAVELESLFPEAQPQSVDILQKMLVLDPSKRISTEDALSHPYLKRYHSLDDEPTCRKLKFDFDNIPADQDTLRTAIWDEIKDYHAKKPQLNLMPVFTQPTMAARHLEMKKREQQKKKAELNSKSHDQSVCKPCMPSKPLRKRKRSDTNKAIIDRCKKSTLDVRNMNQDSSSNLSDTDKQLLERWQNMQKSTKPFVHPIRHHMNELKELKSQSVVKTTALPSCQNFVNDERPESDIKTQQPSTQFQFTNFVPQVKGGSVMLVKEEDAKKINQTKTATKPITVSLGQGQPTILVPIGSIPCYKIQKPINNSNPIVVLPQSNKPSTKSVIQNLQPKTASQMKTNIPTTNRVPIRENIIIESSTSTVNSASTNLAINSSSITSTTNEEGKEIDINPLDPSNTSLSTLQSEQEINAEENTKIIIDITTVDSPDVIVESSELDTQLTVPVKLPDDVTRISLPEIENNTLSNNISDSLLTNEDVSLVDEENSSLDKNHPLPCLDTDPDNVYLDNILTPRNSASGYGLGFDLEEFINQTSSTTDEWNRTLDNIQIPAPTSAALSASLLNEWLAGKDIDPSDLEELQLDLESTSTSILFNN